MPMPASGKHGRTTSEDTIDLIRRLASRYNDTTIAQILSQQNRRTATGLPFRKAHVKALRAYHAIPGYHLPPENVTPGCQDAAVVSITEAARQLGVSSATIYRWLRDGFVTGEQLTPGAPWRPAQRGGRWQGRSVMMAVQAWPLCGEPGWRRNRHDHHKSHACTVTRPSPACRLPDHRQE